MERVDCGEGERTGMTDYIDRQAAIDALTPIYKSASLRNRNVFSIARKCMAAIEELPSAQPEIIRCKDCKHFAGEGMYCSCDIIVQFDHFYCYHAERRQDV